MKIIIGLGNPGKNYEKTRHNVGFETLNFLSEKEGFKFFKKGNYLYGESEGMIFIKPETFMNESGRAVKIVLKKYKVKLSDLIIIHDDFDLNFGEIKISKNRGSAGHKGIESIIRELKTKNFIRIRIGIKSEEIKNKGLEKFVLQRFNKKDAVVLKEIFKKTHKALQIISEKGEESAMNEFNK